jgi:hypothetical protein
MRNAPWLSEDMRLRAYARLANAREFARDTVSERDGRQWYNGAMEHAIGFARQHGVNISTACAVIAVLSPQRDWDQNLKLAEVCLRGDTPRCFKKTAALACEIRDSRIVDCSKMGPKVEAFYWAIQGDTQSVVIDRWMLRAMGIEERGVTRKRYAELVEVVREVAREYGEVPSTFQAIVWCSIRGKSF